jgi:hypothetical protein
MGMMKYIDMLLNAIPQMLSGYFPALFGGDTGGNDTAAGISIQRNQAMGRIGRAWRRMQVFLANTDGKAVRCFAKNRTEDVEIPKQTPSGDYDSDLIRLEDLQGNVTAYPEVDAQYPTLQSDIRALMLNLYNNAAGNPLTMQMMATLSGLSRKTPSKPKPFLLDRPARKNLKDFQGRKHSLFRASSLTRTLTILKSRQIPARPG